MITTINFHLTKSCNFNCKYCFAKFNDIQGNGLSKSEQIELIRQLAESGKFRKINFAGGEPTLVPHIAELIQYAKSIGFETSIVTNGSRIDFEWVKNISPYLDILAVSVDSINSETNIKIGSNQKGNGLSVNDLKNIATACHCFGIELKINTVVSKFNVYETLTDFINEIKPFRWKILQATKITGQNDEGFEQIEISTNDFSYFCSRNKTNILSEINVVTENNEMIKGSYIMIDCLGRFFDDSRNCHSYSNSIIEHGVEMALSQINVDSQKFIARNGNYTTIKNDNLCTF
jgi:radical S-adenosyl methionine domain-containing protein 2